MEITTKTIELELLENDSVYCKAPSKDLFELWAYLPSDMQLKLSGIRREIEGLTEEAISLLSSVPVPDMNAERFLSS